MSLSDQHPYAKLIASGLRSPSLAKARVDVGDNVKAYLVSINIVSFVGWIESSSPDSGSWIDSWDGVC